MKRLAASLVSGFLLTGALFALHLIVLEHFSWKDKPMMPNFFTYLLLPGYRAAIYVPVNHSIQLAITIVVDGLVFSVPFWLLLTVKRGWRRHRFGAGKTSK
jgi:hypothetical protein